MPLVETNFCTKRFGWAASMIKGGSQLRFLAHTSWRGKCVCRKHQPWCSEHFHKKKICIPLEFHAEALGVYENREWSDEEQRDSYLAAVADAYSPIDVAEFFWCRPKYWPGLARAYNQILRTPLKLTGVAFVRLVNMGCLTRQHYPKLEEILDINEISSGMLAAQGYHQWLAGAKIFHGDVPALVDAVEAVFKQNNVPTEIRQFIRRFIFF